MCTTKLCTHGLPPSQALPDALLTALATALASPELREAADHPAARQQLLAVASNAMRWVGPR